jgi:outer membrane receptor for Fe3+-dicitrate
MYYTPSIDRMSSVEIVKGSGSILFGPQTIGGVINYITPDPPQESLFQLNLKLRYRRYGDRTIHTELLSITPEYQPDFSPGSR